MKKRLNITTTLLLAVSLFLNFSFDSHGKLLFINDAAAKYEDQYKGPEAWFCYDGNGNVVEELFVCSGEGTVTCKSTLPCTHQD